MEITGKTGGKAAILAQTVQDGTPYKHMHLRGIVADNDCVNKDAESPDNDMY